MRRFMLLFSVVGVIALAAGIAYSAIPGNDGQLRFCYKAADAAKAGGTAITVIDPEAGGACKEGQASASVLDQGLVTGDSDGVTTGGASTPSGGNFVARVTTSKPTKLFVVGTFAVDVSCETTAPCGLRLGLHVDGEQIEETVRSVPRGSDYRDTAFAVVSVGAGDHIVTWQSGRFGSVAEASIGTWVGAIALGG